MTFVHAFGLMSDPGQYVCLLFIHVAEANKIKFQPILYTMYLVKRFRKENDFMHVYSPGTRADTLGEQKFDCNQNVLLL